MRMADAGPTWSAYHSSVGASTFSYGGEVTRFAVGGSQPCTRDSRVDGLVDLDGPLVAAQRLHFFLAASIAEWALR